jgi:hypothetical protein
MAGIMSEHPKDITISVPVLLKCSRMTRQASGFHGYHYFAGNGEGNETEISRQMAGNIVSCQGTIGEENGMQTRHKQGFFSMARMGCACFYATCRLECQKVGGQIMDRMVFSFQALILYD